MKIKYIRFEVEPREESSNALMGVYEVEAGRGKKKEQKIELMAFVNPDNKARADKKIEVLKEYYSLKGEITVGGLIKKLEELQESDT